MVFSGRNKWSRERITEKERGWVGVDLTMGGEGRRSAAGGGRKVERLRRLGVGGPVWLGETDLGEREGVAERGKQREREARMWLGDSLRLGGIGGDDSRVGSVEMVAPARNGGGGKSRGRTEERRGRIERQGKGKH